MKKKYLFIVLGIILIIIGGLSIYYMTEKGQPNEKKMRTR